MRSVEEKDIACVNGVKPVQLLINICVEHKTKLNVVCNYKEF